VRRSPGVNSLVVLTVLVRAPCTAG
jgi:hypothetical protein